MTQYKTVLSHIHIIINYVMNLYVTNRQNKCYNVFCDNDFLF